MAIPSHQMLQLPPHSGGKCDRRPVVGLGLLALTALFALGCLGPAAASAGPASTRIVRSPGTLVPIPASVPHQEGATIDSRIVGDLRWLAAHFPIYVSEGYSGPLPGGGHSGCHRCHVGHSDHYNGLAVDIVPLRWSSKCDANWRGVTRLADWAEPQQNKPVPPFRWVGYEGDAGHGCGNHLHLSWEHAPAAPYHLAEWVEVFPVGREAAPAPPPPEEPAPRKPRRKRPRARPKKPIGPTGGFSKKPAGPTGGLYRTQSGGLSASGD